MRALRVHQTGDPATVLQLESEVAVPEPGVGQVRIRVDAAALNFADDLICRGKYQEKPSLPFTPGLEVSGEVVAVGPEVTISPGTRVMAFAALPHGGLAEGALAHEVMTFPVPEGFPADQAAAMLVRGDRIMCFKVVSDYLGGALPKKAAVSKLIDNHVDEIMSVLDSVSQPSHGVVE